MSGDEDDYLSDKFLAAASASASITKTYSQLRKEADRKAKLRNEQNRLKSRRQREVEAREEGLSKSLFERAKEEQEAGISSGNKALSMMMKMGFKPGQSLGKVGDAAASAFTELHETDINLASGKTTAPADKVRQLVEPIPLNEWGGKKGIGLGKRARSPTAAERVAKMAKMAEESEETSHQDFRDRASREYDDRRIEGKLGPAQRTCVSLDEKAEKPFHVLWLNPNNPDSFPAGLLDELVRRGFIGSTFEQRDEAIQHRLRRQMQVDALQPLNEDSESSAEKSKESTASEIFSAELVDEALQFLSLSAQARLYLVLSYLRDSYVYCFWCGVEYEDQETMERECPGPEEELHD